MNAPDPYHVAAGIEYSNIHQAAEAEDQERESEIADYVTRIRAKLNSPAAMRQVEELLGWYSAEDFTPVLRLLYCQRPSQDTFLESALRTLLEAKVRDEAIRVMEFEERVRRADSMACVSAYHANVKTAGSAQ